MNTDPLVQTKGLNQGDSAPPGDIQQGLETYVVVTDGEDAIGIQWIEARAIAKHPIMHLTALQNNELPSPGRQQW